MFLASKMKFCLSTDNYSIISERTTIKGFSDVNRNLDREDYFQMFAGENLATKQPFTWKKQFDVGVKNPSENRNCIN